MNITGKTKIAGIVGNPVEHSLSPKIHNFLFERFGIDSVYVPFHIENASDLESFVKIFRSAKFLGANITIPYKSEVLKFVDDVDVVSKNIDAANTLFVKNGKLCADTTDFWGFHESLKKDNFDLTNKNIVILGNGGVAKTIAKTLPIKLEWRNILPESISVIARNKEKAKNIAESVFSFDEEGAKNVIFNADIIINCTPVGMSPNIDESPLDISPINPKTYVFDTIYNPFETKLLREAKAKGCRTQNGLKMLIYQALASFYFWTNIDLTENVDLVLELENLLLKEFNK